MIDMRCQGHNHGFYFFFSQNSTKIMIKREQSKENFGFDPRACFLFSVDSRKWFGHGGSCCHWRVRKVRYKMKNVKFAENP